jgi:hypothetical protein
MMNDQTSKAAEHYGAAEFHVEMARSRGAVTTPDEDARDRQETAALAQVHATLALAAEVSELKTGLSDIQAALSMIYEALGSIERTIGPPQQP